MRKLLLFLFLTSVAGCMVRASPGPYYAYGPGDPYAPSYVHVYADGTCWSDGVFYVSPCPWSFTSGYGYYYWSDGGYYYAPYRSWEYRPGRPPPPVWRHPPRVRDHRDHRVNPPPRVRDHRTRPRGRDHRR